MPNILVDMFSRQKKPNLKDLDRFILGLQQQQADAKNQGYYDRLQRGSSWLAKAKRTNNDPEARFIFLWIALNALCAIRLEALETPWWTKEKELHPVLSKQPHERKTPYELEWLLWRICGLDVGERFLKKTIKDHLGDVAKLLETRYLMPRYWTWNCRTEEEIDQLRDSSLRTVKGAISSLSDRKKMYWALREMIIWRLRVLRVQLMHGCATDTHSMRRADGESELEAGSRILEELIWAFLVLMASHLGQAKYWPPSPYPRAGSPQHKPFDASWLPE